MADDSQNCARDSQTMSEIGDKITVDGNESSPTKNKMTDIISDQDTGKETVASDDKKAVHDQFDSSVSQSALDVDVIENRCKGEDSGSVTDASNNTQQGCPQVTQSDTTSPPDTLSGEPSKNTTENTAHMECNSQENPSMEPITVESKQDDTSRNQTSDVKPQEHLIDVMQDGQAPTEDETREDPDKVSEQSNAEQLLPKPEEDDRVKAMSPKEGTVTTSKTPDEVSESKPEITPTPETLVPAQPEQDATAPTTDAGSDVTADDTAATLSGLRVALPEVEYRKSDTACAAESGAEAGGAADDQAGDQAGAAGKESVPPECVYHVKWVQAKGQSTAIVTQNENGPCPLLAIINCLLLQGRVKLPPMMEMVTSSQLMEYLGDCILGNAPKNITEDAQLNYEQNMQDAMDVFHKLQTGLDVNVRFTGVSDFEYTRECIVFDLLNIPLYHGWLVDPESPEVVAAVGNCSYNQLVEKIISQKNSSREELMTEALIAEEYLERSASQLTYHGLSELVTTVKEDELCVFFRNNHFSTLYKHKKELFLLVTDQGFLTETNVVWETLSNVEGDGHFVDTDFRTFRKPEVSTAPIAAPEIALGTDQQIDQDYLVALSLQQEQQVDPAQAMTPGTAQAWPQPADPGLEPTLSDHELALRLQEEEDRRAGNQRAPHAAEPRQTAAPRTLQHQASTASSGGRKEKKSDCVIL